jgi:hypothetical protein
MVLLGLLTCLPSQATAYNIGISNPSFEADVLNEGDSLFGATSWDSMFYAGIWNPPTDWPSSSFPYTPPDGNNVGWVNTHGLGSYLQQTLNATLLDNTNYTLMVDIGHRPDYIDIPPYKVQLIAGGQILAEGSGFDPGYNKFGTLTINYTSQPSDPIGNNLVIQFSSDTQVNFDNVRLTATAVPIPGALWLFSSGLLGLIGHYRSRRF